MTELLLYLEKFGRVAPQQVELVLSKAVELNLGKDAYYLTAGKVAKQFGFLLQGVMRVYYHNDNGDEVTKYFIEENNIVVDLNSFDNNIPSTAYVQAVTNCRLIVFNKQDWMELLNRSVEWYHTVHNITSNALLQKIQRISPLLAEDATARYLRFLEIYPTLTNRIPLSYLASYLGITQSSLSRIRSSIR